MIIRRGYKYFSSVFSAMLCLFLASCGGKGTSEVGNSGNQVPDSLTIMETVQPDSVSLIFFGDAMMHKRQLERAKALGADNGTYNFDDYYTLISPIVEKADYAVVNLEVALGGGDDYSGYPKFSAPDSYAAALKNAGFDLFLTANNHCLDRSHKGVRRTIHVLDSLQVDHIGTYGDDDSRAKNVPFIKELNGMKIGFLNYTYGTNGLPATDGVVVETLNLDRIKKDVAATREAGAEFIILLPHWGAEYVMNESQTQRVMVDSLLQMGVDAVVGGHPHVVQPMSMVYNKKTGKDAFVAYSLGNFISDMKNDNTMGGVFVRLILARNDKNEVIIRNADYDTYIVEKPSDAKSNYRVVPSWSIDSLPESQRPNWIQHENSVKSLFEKRNVNIPRYRHQ